MRLMERARYAWRAHSAALKGNHRIVSLIHVCLFTAAGDTAGQSELREGKRRFNSSHATFMRRRKQYHVASLVARTQVFKDSQLMDKKLSVTDLDIIFSKVWL